MRIVLLLTLAFIGCRLPGRGVEEPAVQKGTTRLAYTGEGELEGHYRVPKETRPFQISLLFARDGQGTHALEVTTWTESDRSDVSVEKYWVTPNAVLRETTRLEGAEAAGITDLVMTGFPVGEPSQTKARRYGHHRLGDVVDEVRYGPLATRGAVTAPQTLSLIRHEADVVWNATVRLESAEVSNAALAPPVPETAKAQVETGAVLKPLAEGVFEVALQAEETRSLVVEFPRSLVVLEASLTPGAAERIVDAIRARFPNKPIKYVLFGHHHPHYTGGLRAFVAAGATVLAPTKNAAYVQELLARPFRVAPDRLATTAVPIRVEPFSGRRVIEEEGRRLEAIDIGAASNHTEEYLVFYLPKERLLFQGDLGWFTGPDGTVFTSRRASGLNQAILDHKLEVETMVQGWPVVGQQGSLSIQAFRALLAGNEAK